MGYIVLMQKRIGLERAKQMADGLPSECDLQVE